MVHGAILEDITVVSSMSIVLLMYSYINILYHIDRATVRPCVRASRQLVSRQGFFLTSGLRSVGGDVAGRTIFS